MSYEEDQQLRLIWVYLFLRYNLNSVTDGPPTWIGSGFLSMTISQAEAEGKSL